jgi:predicted MPP superfamily phosphohydrolase
MKNNHLAYFITTIVLLSLLSLPASPAPTMKVSLLDHFSFAAFTDTHIGSRYQFPLYRTARHLDALADDTTNGTPLLDFAIHLGDLINRNTAQASGYDLPPTVNQYTNNLAAILLSHLHLPIYPVIGNHDIDDYQLHPDNPHDLTLDLLDELPITTPMYALMDKGILFLFVPELTGITWTHPAEYAWLNFMTTQYHNTTTIICCHQTIPDTTTNSTTPYRGKQDTNYWTDLFQHNPQIKLWIHGHNHDIKWYQNTHTTGHSQPVIDFGHEMAFSEPSPQMAWDLHTPVNRITLYTITAHDITTTAWEDTGTGGHYAPGYNHTMTVNTTFDLQAPGWYAIPVVLQDNEIQLMNLKMISSNITLQLAGIKPLDLFVDPYLQAPPGSHEVILGFGNDTSGNVNWTNPGMLVHGPTQLTFPSKYPDNASLQEDGRSGPPYHAFPMGTTAAAVYGQTYTITLTARCLTGNGTILVNASCSNSFSQYSTLPGSNHTVLSHRFSAENETISNTYRVPNDCHAWFLQGTLDFTDDADYEVTRFSIQRTNTSFVTEDFKLQLTHQWYNVSGPLTENQFVNFTVDPRLLAMNQGVMTVYPLIGGNNVGLANLIFNEPLLLGQNACFQITNHTQNTVNITLTTTITHTSPALMTIWQSTLFKHHPIITERLTRILLAIAPQFLKHYITPNATSTFNLFPFNTNPSYQNVTLTAQDHSNKTHVSPNGNIWWTCPGPDTSERRLQITFNP